MENEKINHTSPSNDYMTLEIKPQSINYLLFTLNSFNVTKKIKQLKINLIDIILTSNL